MNTVPPKGLKGVLNVSIIPERLQNIATWRLNPRSHIGDRGWTLHIRMAFRPKVGSGLAVTTKLAVSSQTAGPWTREGDTVTLSRRELRSPLHSHR